MLGDYSFGKNHRVLTETEYRRVKTRGQKRTSRSFILIQHENDLDEKRIGIIVTRKVAKASIRNLWKRYIKEFFRLNKKSFPASTDSVFIVKRGSLIPKSFESISDELGALLLKGK